MLQQALDQFTEVGVWFLRLLDLHRRRTTRGDPLTSPSGAGGDSGDAPAQEAVDDYDVLATAHLRCGEFQEANALCSAGLELAGDRYPRASAHLRMTEGRALRRLDRPDEAARALLLAHDYFAERADDVGMVATSTHSRPRSCSGMNSAKRRRR